MLPRLGNNLSCSQGHASAYGITLHYLKTVAAMGAGKPAKTSGRTTVARMKSIPTDDDAFGSGSIRADGRGEFPSYSAAGQDAGRKLPASGITSKVLATTPLSEVLHPLLDKCKFPTTA